MESLSKSKIHALKRLKTADVVELKAGLWRFNGSLDAENRSKKTRQNAQKGALNVKCQIF
ncbi:hypothetical protein [Parasphingorhabdus sp.]|uniref:hypothetical protein n=1 Tax=Parasphingorhabdus sp. TaxID=2709688 RepID=UPI002F94B4A6